MTIRVCARTLTSAFLIAVAATAAWTSAALAAPVIANGNTAALVVIGAAGLLAAVASRRKAGRPLVPVVLIASGCTALLIFLVIEVLLPRVSGFVANNYPPTFHSVTRLVDPIGELAVFVLLGVALGAFVWRDRIHTRRAADRHQRPTYNAGPNEMVVEPTAADRSAAEKRGH